MTSPIRIVLLCCAASLLPLPAGAAWKLLRKDPAASLSIDTASVARRGDEVRLRYLVDYAKPHPAFQSHAPFRSMVVDVAVRCKLRSLASGRARLYAAPGARGRLVESTPPGAAPFEPVENGTSDEDLWKHFCSSPR